MPRVKCDKCGDMRYVAPSRLRSESYTELCQKCYLEELHPKRNSGQEEVIKNGLVMLRLPKGHHLSEMVNSNGYVARSRIIMAEKIGRPLKKWGDRVIHIDGDDMNDDPDNLSFGVMQARKDEFLQQFPIDFDFSWKPLRAFYKDWVDTCWKLCRLHIPGRDKHNIDRMYAWFRMVRPKDATTLDLARIVESAQGWKDRGYTDWGEILDAETKICGVTTSGRKRLRDLDYENSFSTGN